MTPSGSTPFQGLGGVSGPAYDLLNKQARRTSLRKGTVIYGPDNPTASLLLLIARAMRVQQCIEVGREIVLYRLHADESCVLTAAYLLAFEDYLALCIAKTDVDAMLLPRTTFDELMTISPQFRAVDFEAYSKRIVNLVTAIDEIAFKQGRCRGVLRQFGHGDAQSSPRTIFH